ncbi:hypothetical protein H6503_05100 [Candidatus Woesearchaeota archaeon]|nr:hypothetical protein [Candidatus Woesearchaeota archaeon]
MVDERIVKIPIKNGVVDIPSYLTGIRHAAIISSTQQEVDRLFALDEEKKSFAGAMVEAAKAKNDSSMTMEIAEEATDRIYDDFFVYDMPPKSWATRLMDVYINRVNYVYKPLIFAGAALVIGSLVAFSYSSLKHAHNERRLNKEEVRVETIVQSLHDEMVRIEGRISSVSDEIPRSDPAYRQELSDDVRLAHRSLDDAAEFFSNFMPAKENVTRQNMADANDASLSIKMMLSAAADRVTEAENAISAGKILNSIRDKLDSTYSAIKTSGAPDQLMIKADTAYDSGIIAIEHRQLESAAKHNGELQHISEDIHAFATMPAELDRAYNSVISVVKHQPTKEWADNMYNNGKSYIRNVDVANLRDATQKLDKMAAQLNQEYEIFIYRDPNGARTVWNLEWYEVEPRRNGKLAERVTREDYFGRSQARDDGRVIPVTFFDVALEEMKTATTFGYRLSGDELRVDDDTILEELKDFVMSGRYQQQPLAEKKRGFPEPDVLYRSRKAGMVLPFHEMTTLVPND